MRKGPHGSDAKTWLVVLKGSRRPRCFTILVSVRLKHEGQMAGSCLPMTLISAASPLKRSNVLCERAMEGVGFTAMVQTIGAPRRQRGPQSPEPRPGPMDDGPRASARAYAHARVLDLSPHAATNFRARACKKTSSAVLNIYRAQIPFEFGLNARCRI